MTTVAILKVLKMDVTPSNDELLVLKVSLNLDHFSFFYILAVSMETAAILNHSMLTATLHMGIVIMVQFYKYMSRHLREIGWTKSVEEKIRRITIYPPFFKGVT